MSATPTESALAEAADRALAEAYRLLLRLGREDGDATTVEVVAAEKEERDAAARSPR